MDKKQIEQWLEEYREAIRSMDTAKWVSKYAEYATAEDPVGGPVHKGHAQLTAFFDGVKKLSKGLVMKPQFTVVAPPEAVVKFVVTNTLHNGAEITFEGVGCYKFNEAGKLIQMRTFFDLEKLGK